MNEFILNFQNVLTPVNLLVCFMGAVYGTMIGILPGMGSAAALAILLPFLITYVPLEQALLFSGVVTYATQYGGSTGAILFNMPGEPPAAITTLDGHPMIYKGQAKTAIFTAAFASFIGGLIATAFIVLTASTIISGTIKLSPVQFLSFIFLSIGLIIAMSGKGNYIKSAIMIILGYIIGLLSKNPTVVDIFHLKSMQYDNILLIIMTICVFSLADVVQYYIKPSEDVTKIDLPPNTKGVTMSDAKKTIFPSVRGGLLGLLLIIPGLSYGVLAVIAYNIEKLISKTKDLFGTGHIPGIAAPEAVNNSGAQTASFTTLLFGIPMGPNSTIIIALLAAKGIELSGGNFPVEYSSIFWTILGATLVANIILLILNWPLSYVWVKLLYLKRSILNAIILGVCSLSLIFSLTHLIQYLIVGLIIGLVLLLKRLNFKVIYMYIGFILFIPIQTYLSKL
jgi:putative tricarboxylic transport membrane protein